MRSFTTRHLLNLHSPTLAASPKCILSSSKLSLKLSLLSSTCRSFYPKYLWLLVWPLDMSLSGLRLFLVSGGRRSCSGAAAEHADFHIRQTSLSVPASVALNKHPNLKKHPCSHLLNGYKRRTFNMGQLLR